MPENAKWFYTLCNILLKVVKQRGSSQFNRKLNVR